MSQLSQMNQSAIGRIPSPSAPMDAAFQPGSSGAASGQFDGGSSGGGTGGPDGGDPKGFKRGFKSSKSSKGAKGAKGTGADAAASGGRTLNPRLLAGLAVAALLAIGAAVYFMFTGGSEPAQTVTTVPSTPQASASTSASSSSPTASDAIPGAGSVAASSVRAPFGIKTTGSTTVDGVSGAGATVATAGTTTVTKQVTVRPPAVTQTVQKTVVATTTVTEKQVVTVTSPSIVPIDSAYVRLVSVTSGAAVVVVNSRAQETINVGSNNNLVKLVSVDTTSGTATLKLLTPANAPTRLIKVDEVGKLTAK